MPLLQKLFPRHFRTIDDDDVLEAIGAGNRYTLDIWKFHREKYGMSMWWTPSGQLYPILHRLERLGILKSTWHEGTPARGVDPDTGQYRRRKAYRLAVSSKG